MPKKKREKVEKHKQSLGEVMEDPETYGVRVRVPHRGHLCMCLKLMLYDGIHDGSLLRMQTKPRAPKRKHSRQESDEEDEVRMLGLGVRALA